MKPGYKILIAIFIVSAFFYYKNMKAKQEERYIKRVESILADIRHEDYFSLHKKFLPKVAKNTSIESIQKYTKKLSLGGSCNFEHEKHEEKNGTTIVTGIVASKKYKLPLMMVFKDINGTLYLYKERIGNSQLEQDGYQFPMPADKSVKVP